MNKKLLLAGTLAVAGFFALTAFNGKTLAQQKEEIAAAVTAQLESLRAEKAAACDARVATEANTRFDAWVAEMAAKPSAKPMKAVKKSAPAKGPQVDPLPSTPPPAEKVDPKSSKMEGGTKVEEKQSKMEGEAPTTDKKKAKMGGGGN